MGYCYAGFDVVGVDRMPQKNYPFSFVLGDALPYALDHWREFDAVHASPPCLEYTRLNGMLKRLPPRSGLPDALRLLLSLPLPVVIENVPGAPSAPHFRLCGQSLGKGFIRHRWFWSNQLVLVPPHRRHSSYVVLNDESGYGFREAVECPWMTRREARQVVPPCYSELIGRQLLGGMGPATS